MPLSRPQSMQRRFFAPRDGTLGYRTVWRVWLGLMHRVDEIDAVLYKLKEGSDEHKAELDKRMPELDNLWVEINAYGDAFPQIWGDYENYDSVNEGHAEDRDWELDCGDPDCDCCAGYSYK